MLSLPSSVLNLSYLQYLLRYSGQRPFPQIITTYPFTLVYLFASPFSFKGINITEDTFRQSSLEPTMLYLIFMYMLLRSSICILSRSSGFQRVKLLHSVHNNLTLWKPGDLDSVNVLYLLTRNSKPHKPGLWGNDLTIFGRALGDPRQSPH